MLIALLLAQTGAAIPASPPVTVRDTTFRLQAGLAVDIVSGYPVQVRIGTGDEVRISNGTARLASYRDPSQLSSSGASTAANAVSIVSPPVRTGRNATEMSYPAMTVTLPSWVVLNITSTANGDVTLAGTTQETTVQTITGAIRVDGGSGKLTLSSLGGPVTVNRFLGTQLNIDAPGGEVGIFTAIGRVQAKSINGSITLRGLLSTVASASTVNGNVQIDGPFLAGGEYSLESHNGPVTIFAPTDFSASIVATTYKGSYLDEYTTATPGLVNRNKDVSSAGGRGGSALAGRSSASAAAAPPVMLLESTIARGQRHTFGAGETHFTLDSFNGTITVRRAGG